MQSAPYYTFIHKSVEMCSDILHDAAITTVLEIDNRKQFRLFHDTKKSESKLGKQFEGTNYILYNRLGNFDILHDDAVQILLSYL